MFINETNHSLIRTVFSLAWPTVLEQTLETMVSYIDAAMVGQIGAAATAAIGCTQTIAWLIGGAVYALGIGFLSYISHELGAKRPEHARSAVAQSSFFILLIGSVISIAVALLRNQIPLWMNVDPMIRSDASAYLFIVYLPMIPRVALTLYGTCLRASGDTKTPLVVTVIMNILNIFLNFILIFPTRTITVFGRNMRLYGTGLGVIGAAIASAISFLIGGIIITFAIYRHREISPIGKSILPDQNILKPVLRISIPCILQRICTSGGYVAFATMVNGIGTAATAAHSIANTAESAFYIPGYGMQTAAATLAGNCWGEKDEHKLRSTCRVMIVIEVILMTFTGTVLFFSAETLMTLFTRDAAVISLGAKVLRMVAVTEPVFGITVIFNGIFQGVGDTRAVFILDVACMWGIRILGTFLFVTRLGHGLTYAWGCMIGHNIMLGILLALRYRSGKWDPILHGRNMR